MFACFKNSKVIVIYYSALALQVGSWKGRSLRPIDPLQWRTRQDRARLLLLEEAKIEVV